MTLLTKRWWDYMLRGILAILLGIAAIVAPGAIIMVRMLDSVLGSSNAISAGMIVVSICLVLIAFVLVDGLLVMVVFRHRGRPRWLYFVHMVLVAALIVCALRWPSVTAYGSVIGIAIWAIFSGIFDVIESVRLKVRPKNRTLLIAGGLAWLAVGGCMIVWPITGAVTVLAIFGTGVIVRGLSLTMLGFRVQRLRRG